MTPREEFALRDLVSATDRLLRAPVLAKTERLSAGDIRAMNDAIKAMREGRKVIASK